MQDSLKPRLYSKPNALVFLPNHRMLETCVLALEKSSYTVHTARTWDEALGIIETTQNLSLGILESTRHLENNFGENLKSGIKWLLIAQESACANREQVRALGIIKLIESSSTEDSVIKAIEHLEACFRDPFFELMDTLEFITGVQLVKEKKSLVESRLSRRLLELGISSFSEYIDYFKKNIPTELPEAISLVTTHTTEFFREDQQFDYLFENVFPGLIQGQKSISIWSAASSTGQEVYSLAISVLEYLETTNIPPEHRPVIRIYGSDIDSACLDTAREGIYSMESVAHLPPRLVKKYFDIGTNELSGFVRIKDFVHQLCQFRRTNLLSDILPLKDVDCVFLRNTMIYFKPSDVVEIMDKVSRVLKPSGLLFLGLSESLTNLITPFEGIDKSIYKLKTSQSPKFPVPASTEKVKIEVDVQSFESLILIGASTGGVEALRTVLENFPTGSPPVLIVQHIPKTFSNTLAKRLNDTCQITVCEAIDDDILKSSHAYIAPGGQQMRVVYKRGYYRIEINNDPPVGQHRPSVDYLFKSIVQLAASRKPTKEISFCAALLTGMGSDGAQGMKELKSIGAYTVAQNEQTSVVFGMPAVAIQIGAAQDVLPLNKIAHALLKHARHRRPKSMVS
jgi:chemotaxis response regulator CheB